MIAAAAAAGAFQVDRIADGHACALAEFGAYFPLQIDISI